MKIALIGCPFQTSYGYYIQRLGDALRAKAQVQWVAANCGCGDPVERERRFVTRDCTYFEWPVIESYRSSHPLRRKARFFVLHAYNEVRARKFAARVPQDVTVEHFQQTLNGYGADVAFRWLGLRGASRRVVTVHEIDPEQRERPEANLRYNMADAVLVHDHRLGAELVELGVDAQRIHLVLHGAKLPAQRPMQHERRDIVFYGGHKLLSGKGLDVMLQAFAALRAEHAAPDGPRLLVHGHYGFRTPPQAEQLAREMGVADHVEWLNQIDMDQMEQLYETAWACVLPFSGSFAGLPAATAAARGAPVIGTRLAGIPEHLDRHFLAVEPGDAVGLADALRHLRDNPDAWEELSRGAYEHASRELSWTAVAARTEALYGQIASAESQPA